MIIYEILFKLKNFGSRYVTIS